VRDRHFVRRVAAAATRLDGALDKIVNAFAHAEQPQSLCHYTSWRGLEGILTSREIWAVDFRAQKTDEKEFRHADETIMAAVSQLAGQLPDDVRHLVTRFVERYTAGDGHPEARAGDELFITCFCRENDNVHVWTHHADRCRGFALEFPLLEEKLPATGYGIAYFPVEYAITPLTTSVTAAFSAVLEEFRKIPRHRRTSTAIGYAINALLRIAAKAAMTFKAGEFSGQCEWRALTMLRPVRELTIVDQPLRHVAIPLRASRNAFPVLNAIHVGRDADVDAEARIVDLLERLGYPVAARPPLLRSSVPPLD
jgi:hypothetical protein